MTTDIEFATVQDICAEHQIKVTDLESITGSFGKQIYFINHAFLLRVSETSMTLEQEKFRRVAALDFVPKIVHTGKLNREAVRLYYTLLTLLPGADFVNAYPQTTEAQQRQLGQAVALFLDHLHILKGTQYDIGLYVPALPHFAGTWRECHQHYWEHLRRASAQLPLKADSLRVFDRAYQFLEASSGVLDYQTGSRLLHNDFHPKNILLDQGTFSGVIDWECSQYGEADFDLCHLIHWCVYPPEPSIDFRPFLAALFEATPECTRVPKLAQRVTIYQIEHELQQIIWNARDAEAWRVPRLIRWLDGGVHDLLSEIAPPTDRS